ncbi:MAG TPA: glycosyltransferase family 39 protein [bacterium]|nr:glycosyltransferase family 39 protein [bacterium]
MKMDRGFMQHYDIYHYRIIQRPEKVLVDYVWEDNPALWNSHRTRIIYRLPLHIQPPLYPTLIWISHNIFQPEAPYSSVAANFGRRVVSHPPWDLAKAQFYAIFVSFFFSLGTLALAYLFCLRFFSFREGLLTVAILATSPVDIAVGTKLYADGVLSFLTFLSLFLYFLSLDRKGSKAILLASLAGLSLGLAYLTKVSGILFAFGFLVATIFHPKFLVERLNSVLLLIAGTAALAVASPWLALNYHYYGSIFAGTPADPGNSWYRYVFGRPLRAYPLGLFWFAPPLLAGIVAGLASLAAPRRRWREFTLFAMAVFYMAMFMVFARTGTAGVEDRYLLPIYPLLAVLAGVGLVAVIQRIPGRHLRKAAYGLLILGLLASAARSAEIGLSYSFRAMVVFKPFGY